MPAEYADTSVKWRHNVAAPCLDLRMARPHVTPGLLTKASGVDGRFSGAVRRYPGHRLVVTLPGTATDAVNFCKWVEVHKTGATVVRGFVFRRVTAGSPTTYPVVYYYYDPDTAAWASVTLDANSANAIIDVTSNGWGLYYAKAGSTGKIMLWITSAFVVRDLGVASAEVEPTAPAASEVNSGGVLGNGTWFVAYRFWDTKRNLYSGMSTPTQVTIASDPGTEVSRIQLTSGFTSTNYDKVQVFRSISAAVAGSSFAGGALYLDGTYDMPTVGGPPPTWITRYAGTTLQDELVVQQEYFDPLLDSPAMAPMSGVIHSYQGTLFMGGPEDAANNGYAQLRWAALHSYAPESFPSANTVQISQVNDRILGFVEVGDTLFGIATGVLWKIQKLGGQLVVTRLQHARGAVGRFAACEVGRDMLLVTAGAVLLVDGQSGALTSVGALDRLVNDPDYWTDVSSVYGATDGAMECSFLLNTVREEAVCIWGLNNSVTLLEDMNFVAATSGVHPTAGGPVRAFFVTSAGRVVCPDDDRTGTKQTQQGVAGTVNGVCLAAPNASTTTVIKGSGFATDLGGSYLYFLTGQNAGAKRLIASSTPTAITCAAFAYTPAVGDVYAVSPVPFRLRYWPLGVGDEVNRPRDCFLRRSSETVHVLLATKAGEYTYATNPGAFLTVGMYAQAGATMAVTGTIPLDRTWQGAAGTEPVVQVFAAGGVLELGIEQLASNVDFELYSALVVGRIDATRKP